MAKQRVQRRRPGLFQSLPTIVRGARQLVRTARAAGMSSLGRPTLPMRKRRRLPQERRVVRRPMRGNFRGNFKKPRKFKPGSFSKYGVIRTVESGAVLSGPDCVYVGHTFGVYSLWQTTLSAIIRRLFEKAGISIKTMLDKVQGDSGGTYTTSPGDVQITHQNFNGGALQVLTYPIPADSTFEEVMQGLQTLLYSAISATDTSFQFSMIRWHPSKDATEGYTMNAQIDLSMAKVHFGCYSSLTLQNRTSSSSAAGQDETSALDVANNPVQGKSYAGGGNGATLRGFNNSLNVAVPIGDPTNGVISPSLGALTPEQFLIYKRPASANAFNFVKKTGSVRLGPGALKKDHLKFDQSMLINTLLRRIKPMLDVSQAAALITPIRSGISSFNMFGFEKMCNTRTLEPDIDIGYEINQTYRARITEGKRGLMAFHN